MRLHCSEELMSAEAPKGDTGSKAANGGTLERMILSDEQWEPIARIFMAKIRDPEPRVTDGCCSLGVSPSAG
jgi:hypothetical protein